MPSRRSVVAGLAAMPIALSAGRAFAQAVTGDTIATSAGDLVIHPINHASLVLASGAHVFYVDPAKVSFAGLPPPTGILVTHSHGDHFDPASLEALAGSAPILTTEDVLGKLPETLKGQAIVLKNGASGTLDGIAVDAIAAYNTTPERAQYHPQGRDNGYVLRFGDKKIYIGGDTEDTPEMRALTGIDVAFLPMVVPFTMSIEQAADAVAAFKPKIVYPYHYGESDTPKFKELVGGNAEVRLIDWYAAAG
jgi:L-ascorbate metabolism protein UlaG (beta-lactamase superfamily)